MKPAKTEHLLDLESTKDTQLFALKGELWGFN